MKWMIFGYKKIFGSGPFLIFFQISWIEKMAGAKKVVKMKNHFFHARQPREGIFDVCSPWCCIFTLFVRTWNGSCFTNFENWCLKMKFIGLYHDSCIYFMKIRVASWFCVKGTLLKIGTTLNKTERISVLCAS